MISTIEIEFMGWTYSLPAKVVASHRAKYYSDTDEDTSFEEEFDFAINDKYTLLDWMQNNMDYEDIGEVNFKMIATPGVVSAKQVFDRGESRVGVVI